MKNILFIRHGKGRGPNIRLRGLRPAYFQPFIDEVKEKQPGLYKRFRFWETGSKRPNLQDVSCIVNWVQDPLKERFPACFSEIEQIEKEAERLGIRIINPALCLSHSMKSVQAKLWEQAGLPSPKVQRVNDYTKLREALNSATFPMVIRGETLHSQKSLHFIEDRDSFQKIEPQHFQFPVAISPFFDTRKSYQIQGDPSVYATHFHKKRAMVVGHQVRNNHVFFSKDPIVGSKNSTFGHGRSFNPLKRMKGNRDLQPFLEADFDFWAQRSSHQDMLLKASQALGLGFVSIDYSEYATGEIILWEANPCFALHMWPITLLEKRRKLKSRIASFHETICEELGKW